MTVDLRTRVVPTRLVPRFARLRGLAALMALLAAVAGVPAALLLLGRGLPLDLSVLTPEALLRPDDGRLLILALYAVGWAAWLVFTASVSIEVVAILRGIPAPNLPGLGPAQRMAAGLLAATALLTVTSPVPAQSSPVHAAPAVAVAATAAQNPPAPATSTTESTRPIAAQQQTAHQDVTVRRHDTLWALAERHLGDGARYTEILELNRGVTQSDGRQLLNPSWLYPGWTLRLPNDARIDGSGRVDGDDDVVVVRPGDTLWEIAEDELGDGARYREVFEENVGDLQPDGGRLADPDLILVGWELDIPSGDHEQAAKGSQEVEPGTEVGASSVGDGENAEKSPAATGAPERQATTSSVSEPRPGAPIDGDGAGPENGTDDVLADSALDDVDEPDEVAPASGLLAVGIGGIALAGFVGEVSRRRRYQRRVRGVGERIPMPDGDAANVEAQARALSDLPRAELLQRAMRALAESARQAGRPLPDVRTMRIAKDGIEVILPETEDALAPFVDRGDGRWALDDELLASAGVGSIDPYPGLVTVGADGDDVLLLNLESVGGLGVTGEDDAVVAGVLRAMAADLALTPSAGTVLLDGMLADLAEKLDPGRVTTPSDPGHIRRLVDAHERLVRQSLDATPDADMRRLRIQGQDEVASGCLALVAGTTAVAPPDPWLGIVRVQFGRFDAGGGEHLHVRNDGTALLESGNCVLRPATLSETRAADVAEVLGVADRPSTPAPLRESAMVDALDPRLAVEGTGPRVLLLGRVEVVNVAGKCSEPRIARLTEAVAYLALNPGSTREELAEAIWQGRRVEQSTKWNLVSRVRTWLGVDESGQHYLQTVQGHGVERLRLAPAIATDWHDFLKLAETGRLADGAGDRENCDRALQLVRGRPFLGIDARRYAWAEPHIQEMVSFIVDCAVACAERHRQRGDHHGARVAATRGLQVDPLSERLAELAIAASTQLGDGAAGDRIRERYEQDLRTLDAELAS